MSKKLREKIKQNHDFNQECSLRNTDLLLKKTVQVIPSNPKNSWSNCESLYAFIILHFQQTSIYILKDDFWHIFLSWSLRAVGKVLHFYEFSKVIPKHFLGTRKCQKYEQLHKMICGL